MAARASSSSSSLAYFHDIGSLSRASALANDAQRSVRQLEEQVAAAEQSVPSALEAVRSEATSALQHLDKADGQRETFEATAKAQLRETARLAEQLNPPREQLRRLRDAQLVLHVLVVADELLQEVNQAQRAAADASPPSGATSATVQLLLRLQTLRACVRAAADDAPQQEQSGGAAIGDDAAAATSSSSSSGALQLTEETARALLVLLDARARKALPTLRASISRRVSQALAALGWPADLKGALPGVDGAFARSDGMAELKAATTELLILQYICGGEQVTRWVVEGRQLAMLASLTS